MTVERTLSIVKPDAVSKNVVGEILNRFERNGLKIIACKMISVSAQMARDFYAEHKERPFYGELVNFMSSGPVVVQVLEGEDAIKQNRELMGDTDPSKAAPGTIRSDYAKTIEANAVHGSDSPTSAKREIDFFFKADEICARE